MIVAICRYLGCLILLSACSSPSVNLLAQAEQLHLQRLDRDAGSFVVTLFYQPSHTTSKSLHVYLEGDGQPWLQGLWPAADPTTRTSLMLPLLAIDTSPAIYLGRPCYNGHTSDPGCEPRLWTNARYAEEVVDSMTTALTDFCVYYGFQQLVLIGHSGGGSLAMLMAQRMPQTRLLITLAGNYDIDIWADYHHYQRLSESLNPAKQNSSNIPEWHFLGEQDTVVPPKLFVSTLKQRANSQVEILQNIEHQHGWQTIWPHILERLSQQE